MSEKPVSRRQFLHGLTLAAASVPVLGGLAGRARSEEVRAPGGPTVSPSQKLHIAGIGIGGQGFGDLKNVAGGNEIVALCDVDDKHAAKAYNEWPNARRHKDFRKMLEEQKDIDAVVIATPDHLHYTVAMWAMKLGKHVYCEKPLTRTIGEARALSRAAAENPKLATQMGNGGNAGEGWRRMREWLEAGVIGPVREIHCWTNRPIWPQALERPKERPEIPATLAWDLWLGPAPERPYHPSYLPFVWRGWWDFGTGAMGDMACHVLVTPFRALDLSAPLSVISSCARTSDKVYKETAPAAAMITFEFPAHPGFSTASETPGGPFSGPAYGLRQPPLAAALARAESQPAATPAPPLKLVWYDGGLMPARPEELPPERILGDWNGGILFHGDEGKVLCDIGGGAAQILPEKRAKEFKQPPRRIPRSRGHHAEWIAACKGGPQPGSHFERAARLTEIALLGNVALRHNATEEIGRASKLLWDAQAGQVLKHENGQVTHNHPANRFVSEPVRKGWEV